METAGLPGEGRHLGRSPDDVVAAPPGTPIGKSAWERVSALTCFGRYRTPSQRRALDLAAALVGTTGRALDAGSGEGRWAVELYNRGWDVVCSDIKETLLDACRSRVPEARMVLVDPTTTELPMADSSARLVLAYEVPAVNQKSWFPAESRRVLEPGGALVCTFRNPWSWRGLLAKAWYRCSSRRRAETDASYFGPSYRRFRKSLRQQGFRIAHEEGICWIPLSSSSDSALVYLFGRIERALRLPQLVTFSPTVVLAAVLDAEG